MKKPTNGKGDPVRLAEQALAEAQARLAANLKEQQERTAAITRLEETLGANPDAKEAERLVNQIRVHEARLKYLAREEKGLHTALREAEAALQKAMADRAEAEKQKLERAADADNDEAREHLRLAQEALTRKRGKLAQARALAREFALVTPRACRLLLGKAMILNDAAEEIRGALDSRHALGGLQQQPTDSPPLFAVPA